MRRNILTLGQRIEIPFNFYFFEGLYFTKKLYMKNIICFKFNSRMIWNNLTCNQTHSFDFLLSLIYFTLYMYMYVSFETRYFWSWSYNSNVCSKHWWSIALSDNNVGIIERGSLMFCLFNTNLWFTFLPRIFIYWTNEKIIDHL